MKPFGLLLCLLISQVAGFAQTDSSMLKRLNKAIYTCEIIGTNSQQLISKYSTIQTDSITRVLTSWEAICQRNEPINRIKILLAIQSENVSDTLLATYLFHYRYKYVNRMESTHMSSNYEYYREYYDYVPAKGEFDRWTARWANDLINNQPLNSSAYFLCLLLGNHIKEFNDAFEGKQFRKHPLVVMVREMQYARMGDHHPFAFKAGLWVPTGKLATDFKPATLIGFELGGEISENSRLDFVFDIAFLTQNTPIALQIGSGAPVQTTAKVVIDLGINYTRQFQINKVLGLDAIGGIGYGRIDTDLKKPAKPDEDDSYYGAGTIDFSWGAMLRTKVGVRHQMGLRVMYHYAPYQAMSKILTEDIGNQYYTAALVFRF